MKRFKRTDGVTLLEIMLVLAIAAMVIVMSIRYYQSATSSQQVNTILSQIQAIVAGADGLAQATGNYQTAGVSNATLQPLLPPNGLNTPWGTNMTVAAASGSTFTIAVPGTPAGVCPLLVARLIANNHFTSSVPAATCTGDVTITYRANP